MAKILRFAVNAELQPANQMVFRESLGVAKTEIGEVKMDRCPNTSSLILTLPDGNVFRISTQDLLQEFLLGYQISDLIEREEM